MKESASRQLPYLNYKIYNFDNESPSDKKLILKSQANEILVNLKFKIINNIETINIISKKKNRLINSSSLIYIYIYKSKLQGTALDSCPLTNMLSLRVF
jgi:hypothetical protein